MKHWIGCVLIMSVCGCNSGELNPSVEAAPSVRTANGEELASPADAQLESARIHSVKHANELSTPQSAAGSAHSVDFSEELSQLLAPLSEGECFFSVPTGKKVQVDVKGESKTGGTQKDSIRLLGFVHVGTDQQSKTQAVLRVNSKLTYVSEGDQLDDLEVLSIAAPVVTFQQQRQRWSVSLHDQPVSPTSSTGRYVSTRPPPRPARQRSVAASAQAPAAPTTNSVPSIMSPPPVPELPALPGVNPNSSNGSGQQNSSNSSAGSTEPTGPELPQVPQLPDLPGVPTLPELPEDLQNND